MYVCGVKQKHTPKMNLNKTSTSDLVADAKYYMNELVYLAPASEQESEQAAKFIGDLVQVAYELGERNYRQSFIQLCMDRTSSSMDKFNY